MDSLTFDVSEDEGADKGHDDDCHRQREVGHQLPFAGVEEGPAEREEVVQNEGRCEEGRTSRSSRFREVEERRCQPEGAESEKEVEN